MRRFTLLSILFFFSRIYASGMDADSLYVNEHYDKTEYRIPMRDGVTLYTVVYSPKDRSVKYPILYYRTPYSVSPYGNEKYFIFRRGLSPAFLREGFIFVFQDVRGRFMSEGTFMHMRPFIENKRTERDVDESSDAFDTMDWLIKNLDNHNGRIGMWGISYPAYYASCATINGHTAFKCASLQAPIGDWFFDDAHHQGAFFLSAMFGFIAAMDLPRHGFTQDWVFPFQWKNPDGYSFFMNLEPLPLVKTNYFGDSIAFWNDMVDHPNYDRFWQERNIIPHLKNVKPAVMVVGGWYDAEDLYGTFHTYQSIEKNNPDIKNNLVIGPWIHGGWARTDGSYLGNVSFESKTSLYYRDSIELPFFNYYLKDKDTLDLHEATMFMTGRNVWKKFGCWPPENVKSEKIFLHEGGRLAFTPARSSQPSFDEFVSNPGKPVPYTEDIFFDMTKEYMTDDQRFASKRPDVLVYETAVLDSDIILAGSLTAHLKVSTTGGDADWVVKLIDVYPEDARDNPTTRKGMRMGGYQQMVRSEIIRGRFRNSFEKPEPFVSGKTEEINMVLQDVLHCFQKGHRIMVQIQSTWFPLADLNPQKYVENIYRAKAEDFISATHRVFHDAQNESYLEVGIYME